MDTKKLEILLEVIHAGSMKKAAEKFNYTQSGLLYTLNTLERDMGIPLLSRDFKGVSLSQEGEYLLPYIQDVVEAANQLEEAMAQVTEDKFSDLFVGSYPSIARHWLPAVIEEFVESNPNINIHICVGVEDIPKWLDADIISIAIGERGIVGDNRWIPLQKHEVYVAVPSSEPIASRKRVSLEELASFPVLLSDYNPKSEGNAMLTKWALSRPDVKNYNISAPDGSTALSMVGKGLGIAFLSCLYAHECPDSVTMLPLNPPLLRETGIIVRAQKPVSPLVKAFISFMQKKVETCGWK